MSWYSDFDGAGHHDSMMHVPVVHLPVEAVTTTSITVLKSLNIIIELLSCFP